ncbi:membrane protein [Gordonia phage Whitney]|nr:membrane protein [Gordonia phage Whitney]
MRAAVVRIGWVLAHTLAVLAVGYAVPPKDFTELIVYTLVGLGWIITMALLVWPQTEFMDGRDVVGQALRVLPPDGGEQ